MRSKLLGLLVVAAMALTACGTGMDSGLPEKSEEPIVQIRSEGGFAPVEFVLGRGPTYTLLANGRLIYEGPVIAIYPGPLLPNYQVVEIEDGEMSEVLRLIDEIGLPEFEEESDNSANQFVADATTEVVTYWDETGTHTYSVYALGMEPGPSVSRNKVFQEVIDYLGRLAATHDAVPYESDRVRVIAGIGFSDPDTSDVREWPFDETDFTDWEVLPNQWMCRVYGAEILPRFTDATQSTEWTHPNPTMDADAYKLLVRPLHPGEPDCPEGT